MKLVNIYLSRSGYDLGEDFFKEINSIIHPPVKKYDIGNLVASSPEPGTVVYLA